MAIPTGYTLETFGQWLTGEMFFSDTKGLGLSKLGGDTAATYKDLVLSGNTTFVPTLNSTYTLNIEPSPFIFDRNEVIYLDNGIQLTVDPGGYHFSGGDATLTESVDYGDTTMVVKVTGIPVGTDIHDGLKVSLQTGSSTASIDNPTIESIMNKALARMNLDGIEDINATNMYVFRRIAIVEALETIMQNNVSFYPLIDDKGNTLYGGTLSDQLTKLFGYESTDLANYLHNLALESAPSPETKMNILTEGLSSTSSVGVVW